MNKQIDLEEAIAEAKALGVIIAPPPLTLVFETDMPPDAPLARVDYTLSTVFLNKDKFDAIRNPRSRAEIVGHEVEHYLAYRKQQWNEAADRAISEDLGAPKMPPAMAKAWADWAVKADWHVAAEHIYADEQSKVEYALSWLLDNRVTRESDGTWRGFDGTTLAVSVPDEVEEVMVKLGYGPAPAPVSEQETWHRVNVRWGDVFDIYAAPSKAEAAAKREVLETLKARASLDDTIGIEIVITEII